MTAEELTLEILDRRNVGIRERDYWTCFEVNEREEAGGWLPGLVRNVAQSVLVWAAAPVCSPMLPSVATGEFGMTNVAVTLSSWGWW